MDEGPGNDTYEGGRGNDGMSVMGSSAGGTDAYDGGPGHGEIHVVVGQVVVDLKAGQLQVGTSRRSPSRPSKM
jgi:hypothetical protein